MSVIEMSRPSVEQVSSLNSTRSRNSNDSKSSASELLSITDAAVSALSKTSNPKVKSYVRNKERQNGISLLSPNDRIHSQTSASGCDVSGQLSDGSRSTTESEVLIMSTLKDHDVLAHHDRSNVSEMSKCSNTSGASSAFITGQAQRVKVSSKKLKEIKSPFENKNGESKISVGNVERGGKSSKIISREASMSTKKDDKMQNSQRFDIGEMKTFAHQRLNATDEHISNKETIASTDSGYMTQNIKVIREKWSAQGDLDIEETPRDVPSITEEINVDLHSNSPIDVIAQDKERQSSDTSDTSGHPDIFTVRETLVTIRATDVDGSASQSSVGSSANQQVDDVGSTARSLEQRFSKFNTSHLRQGTLGADNQNEATLNNGQVYIAKTSLTEKEKQLKEAFCKRDPPTHAMKKHVIPTVIKRELSPAVDPKASGSTSVNEAATTAAVAAASAVAATQPFLKAQQDMEMRIAQLIQQISSVQQRPQSTSGPDNNKIEELERQLNDLTQHRIQYLEDMQKQQLQWQAQFLGMSRTAGSRHVAPPSDHQHYDGWEATGGKKAFRKHVMSDEELGFGQYRPNRSISITQEKGKSVLDTPAPRSKPPTPTILDDSQRSAVRGHIKEHVTPDRKNKVSGGLLAQILSQDGDTPQKTPFPETPPSVRLPAKR